MSEPKSLYDVIPQGLMDELIENGLYSEETRLLGEFCRDLQRRGYRYPELTEMMNLYSSLPTIGQVH